MPSAKEYAPSSSLDSHGPRGLPRPQDDGYPIACAHVSHQGTPKWVPGVSQRRSLLQPLRAAGGWSRRPFAGGYRSASTPPQPPIFRRAHRDPVGRELRCLCTQMRFWPSFCDHATMVSPTSMPMAASIGPSCGGSGRCSFGSLSRKHCSSGGWTFPYLSKMIPLRILSPVRLGAPP